MPPVNDTAANAITLSIPSSPVSGSTVGSVTGTWPNDSYPNVWYKLTPSNSVAININIVKTSGTSAEVWADVNLLIGSDPPTGWGNLDWIGSGWWDGTSHSDTLILTGGETYYIDVYGFPSGEVDFSIEIVEVTLPDGDMVADAILVEGGATVLEGSTVYASEEPYEGGPSIWYRVYLEGPGILSVKVEGLNGWIPDWRFYYKPGGGIASSFNELISDNTGGGGDGTANPPWEIYDGDFFPIDEGGINIYIRVSGWSFPVVGGAYKITIHAPPPIKSLQAKNYINEDATTASLHPDGVAITQELKGYTYDPHKAWFKEFEPSLIIRGEDVTDTPGLFAVSIVHKNENFQNSSCIGGLSRNGFPFVPGAFLDEFVGTPGRSWLTAVPLITGESDDPGFFDTISTIWRFPIAPGDEIKVYFGTDYPYWAVPGTVIVSQICFQKVAPAMVDPPFDIINFPDYPLGTSGPPIGRGALTRPPTASEPTNTGVTIIGMDMCITDDETIWVAHNQWNGTSSTRTGPVLQKWNGSSWIVINENIEGLGIRRSITSNIDPYGITIATDGEDIYLAYLIDTGLPTSGGATHNTPLRVKKYDVSANSWSNIGNPVWREGDGPQITKHWHIESGTYDNAPHLSVGPDGTLWLAFTDMHDAKIGNHSAGYVARWDGARWRTNKLPHLKELQDLGIDRAWNDEDFAPYCYQARSYRYYNGTNSETSYLGETVIDETQTSYNGDTIRIVPPAGKWGVSLKIAWKRSTMWTLGGYKANLYRNGSKITNFTDDSTGSSSGGVDSSTYYYTQPTSWQNWNGSDELEIRVARTGTASHVYIDEVQFIPHWLVSSAYQPYGNINYVGDGQYSVQLLFNNPNNPNYPRAVYFYIANYPEWIAENQSVYETQAGNWVQMAEWTGSDWQTVWEEMPEDSVPNYVGEITKPEAFGWFVAGHWQQGMGTYYDAQSGKSYLMACLGMGGSWGDTLMLAEITETGLQYINGASRSAGIISSTGYSPNWYENVYRHAFSYNVVEQWGWDCHCKSMTVDAYGNIWYAYIGAGTSSDDSYSHTVGTQVDYGTGGWVAANDHQFQFASTQYDSVTPVVLRNPSGDKIYILLDGFISENLTYPLWKTFGVWECPIVRNAYIPLKEAKPLELSRVRFRAYGLGDDPIDDTE